MITIIASIVSFCGGALSSFIVQRLVANRSAKRDKKTILAYLQSRIPSQNNWLSTKNISSNTNLTRARVEEICSTVEEIQLSTGENDGRWGLRGISVKTSN